MNSDFVYVGNNFDISDIGTLSKNFNKFPLLKTIDIRCDPISLINSLKVKFENNFILDGYELGIQQPYTYIGFKPTMKIKANNDVVFIDGVKIDDKPKEAIERIINSFKSPNIKNLPKFTGGFVGYFAYEFIKYIEKSLRLTTINPEDFLDYEFMLFNDILVYDNNNKKLIIITNIDIDKNVKENYNKGLEKLNEIEKIINETLLISLNTKKNIGEFSSFFTKSEFCDIVLKTKSYIKEGDIFQCVPSNRKMASYEGDFLSIYDNLSKLNPSPYMFYLQTDNIKLAGTSPETLVNITDNEITTCPLAGTRKRGKNNEEDLKIIDDLLTDEKELSEHNMLVDLARNDIGRVSKYGSVKVTEYLQIKKFSHVIHIASKVKGEIRSNITLIDVIGSILPAGTLSGAPKIRACEIINELENTKRGCYGGAIGYIGYNGNSDVCIGIRMIVNKNDKVFIQSGAGIVFDSIPEIEFDETLNKLEALTIALTKEDL
jgi:anthranilate synthase component 1